EADAVGAAAAEAVRVADLVALAPGPVEEDLALLLRQLLPGRVGIDPVVLRDRLNQPLLVAGVSEPPGLKRALGERQGRIGHHQVGVDDALEAEPVAALAGAVRRVEGEDPRLELRDRGPAVEAGEALAEREPVADVGRQLPGPLRPLRSLPPLLGGIVIAARLDYVDLHDAARERRGRFDRLREPASQVALHD